MRKYCYWNGSVVELEEVKISPYDLGFMRGYGIFDAMRTANGVLFCFDEHWDKFDKTSLDLGLRLDISKNEYRDVVKELMLKNNLKEAAVKTILTGGESENGFKKGVKPTFLILVDDLDNFKIDPKLYLEGWKLVTLEFKRCLPETKNINYLMAIKNQDEKMKAGAQEILYKNNGKILECSTSNIFMIKNGVVITPQEDIFLGTTRNLVIDLAKKNNFQIKEQDITEEEFKKADEIFLTATYKKIIPIVEVDDWAVGEGKVGIHTRELMNLLDEFIKSYS